MPITNSKFISEGRSFASFGEVIQGRKTDGSDFLVTLPIDLWSSSDLKVVLRQGQLVINCDLPKSKIVAEMVLHGLGISENCELDITITKKIPEGKGLSSSTADMLATLRALQNTFGFELTPAAVANLFKLIEPHDGLMYDASVFYNHRNGELLKLFNYIPSFTIIAIDCGGTIDSIEYNKKLTFCEDAIKEYDKLYAECISAYNQEDDLLIANCATKSLEVALMNNKNHLKELLLKSFRDFDALGVINTHSGTCIGYIYKKEVDDEILKKIKRIERAFNLPVFATSTLRFSADQEKKRKAICIQSVETLDEIQLQGHFTQLKNGSRSMNLI